MTVQRTPSTQWEPAVVPNLPGSGIWVWYFPPHAPQSATVSVPQNTTAQFGPYLTARAVAAAIGWPADAIANWSFAGTVLDCAGGMNPAFDQPFPMIPGVDVEVVFTLKSEAGQQSAPATTNVAPTAQREANPMEVLGLDDILAAAEPAETSPAATAMPTPQAMPAPTPVAPFNVQPTNVGQPAPAAAGRSLSAAPDANADRIFAAIDADWKAIEQLERQLASLTKQLNGQAGKLNSLNRDLNTNERMAADSNDVKDWTDARRFLREASAAISRQVRAFDIGTVSSAGNRNRFHEIYESHVRPRVPFDNMVSIAQEFEAHRKVCQNLLTQSSSALSGAQRDAEGKARSILSRIAAKARAKK